MITQSSHNPFPLMHPLPCTPALRPRSPYTPTTPPSPPCTPQIDREKRKKRRKRLGINVGEATLDPNTPPSKLTATLLERFVRIFVMLSQVCSGGGDGEGGGRELLCG